MIEKPVVPGAQPSSSTRLDRRGVLGALGVAGLLPVAAAAGAATPRSATPPGVASAPGSPAAVRPPFTSSFLKLDPAEAFRQVMRLQRSLLDADDILHWYHFIMYAVPVEGSTVPVVRWEGIELSRHERIGDALYRMHGHNLSYPRDLDSGEFVDMVLNPVTAQRVPIAPMRLTQDPGLLRSPAGTITLDRAGAPPRRDYRVLRREGDWVKVDTIRVPPATWPQPFIEGGYEGALAADFDDPTQLCCAPRFRRVCVPVAGVDADGAIGLATCSASGAAQAALRRGTAGRVPSPRRARGCGAARSRPRAVPQADPALAPG